MFIRSSWSIRKWLGGLAAAVAVPLCILLVALFASEVARERGEAREQALRIARATAVRLRVLHRESVALLTEMAARPDIRHFDGVRCDSLFAIVDFYPQYANLLYFDAGGRLRCAGRPAPEDRAISQAAEGWIGDALRAGRTAGAPAMHIVDGRWVSVQSMPVTAEGGSGGGTLSLIQLPELVSSEALPPKSVVTVIDGAGTIIARTAQPQTWSGHNVRQSPLTTLGLTRPEGVAEADGVDGVPRQYGFTSIPELGWHIYVGIPTDTVMAPVQRFILRGVAGGAAIIAATILLALSIAGRIQRPLNALARAAGSIARGTPATVPVEGPREIVLLANAFNEMVATRTAADLRIGESERSLKAVSERLLLVQEEERARIAREIHDDLGQSLTALKMDIGGLLLQAETATAAAPVRERILRTLDATVTAVQRIAAELRPTMLDDLGLAAAIESEARLFEERTGIECEVSIPSDELTVPPQCATALYRIVQEGLTNVLRHSDATRVELRIRRRGEELLLEIRDDGRGMTETEISAATSFGLRGIRERAEILGGSVRFEGVAGRGSIVSVRIPAPGAGVSA